MTTVVNRQTMAKRIAHAVEGVPGVTRLVSEGPVEVSTQFAYGKVPGVRLEDHSITVRVAVNRLPASETADRVREAVVDVAGSGLGPVTVIVADLDMDRLPDRTDEGVTGAHG